MNHTFSYQALFRAAAPLAVVDSDLGLLQVNPAFSAMFEVPAEAMVGTSLLDCVVESDHGEVREACRGLAANPGAEPEPITFRFRNVHGKLRYVRAFLRRLPESAANLLTLIDVTKEKYFEYQLKKRLRETQQQHQALDSTLKAVQHAKQEWERIIDCVDGMVILTDNWGHIKRCSKSLKTQLGLDYKELLGQPFDKLFADFELIPRQDGESYDLFNPKTQHWYHVKTFLFMEQDETASGAVITVNDFTEMKRLNQDLTGKGAELEKAYEELKATQSQILHQEKMACVGQLAAGVAHEINNPMGFIISNLSTLEKYIERFSAYIQDLDGALANFPCDELAALSSRRKELKIDFVCADSVDLIRESLEGADRVKNIVQNLKGFSRVDSAQCCSTDINECLESTISIIWNEIKYKATLERDYGKLPLLTCYPQQLNQVFLNLLVNAAQAIPEQGVIRVETRCEQGDIRVKISDTGGGIPPEVLSRIFEPFFTTKEIGKGTGLGLSISFEIVQKHGGEILVDSRPGEGTTFTLRLPLQGVENSFADGVSM
ncbi:MAG: ATP-binding protein [Desulfuromonadaceae bacterium]